MFEGTVLFDASAVDAFVASPALLAIRDASRTLAPEKAGRYDEVPAGAAFTIAAAQV
jgi:hypothetical protein